jgi:hypothetical protein
MNPTRRLAIVFAGLLVFGFIKWPMEVAVRKEQKAASFHAGYVDLGFRQRMSQDMLIAALSGFRSLVATFCWFQANDAWSRTEWGSVANLINVVTTLQPRNVRFWDEGGWHMGWNAANAALNNRNLRDAQRKYEYHKYLDQAEAILKRGIANNPDKWNLFFTLGNLYRDKFLDHCRAAEQYEKAARFANAPSFMRRFAAYEYAQCPGKERTGYEQLRRLYLEGEKERLPTLERHLAELEEKLAIPPEQRVYNAK